MTAPRRSFIGHFASVCLPALVVAWGGSCAVAGYAGLTGCAGTRPPQPGPAPALTRAAPPPAPVPPARADRPSATHLLDRFAFGPRPKEVERVMRVGADAWLDEQLAPARIVDAAGDAALSPYRDVLAPPQEIPKLFAKADVPADYDDGEDVPANVRLNKLTDFKKVLRYAQMSQIARHVHSQRQVLEVMVDFWVNHFNVFARKGLVKLYAADYVERAIRPHALGRFEDLLVATARHPAMLIYLDNAKSSAPPKPGSKADQQKKRGITENYSRELLELHTLGVGGGYTQQDVIEVARVLTGWSVGKLNDDRYGYEYRARAHDAHSKVVLGQSYPEGGGEEEGKTLLHQLALHPSTARRLAGKLCERFVADSPPPRCIENAQRAYLDSSGDIGATIRAVERSPEFWAESARGSKVKSPLEFMVSALRALDAGLDGSDLAKATDRLGQPPLLDPVPTGYPERAEDWASTSGALARMGFASQLAAGKLQGVHIDIDRLLGNADGADALVARVNDVVLAGKGSPATLQILRAEIEAIDDAKSRRVVAIALGLGSPDFQKQ